MLVTRCKTISLLALALLVLIPYQNCSKMTTGSSSQLSASAKKGYLGNGGQPYDGKTFIVKDNCIDGTKVDARVLVRDDGSGTLYRENCQTGNPRDLTQKEIILDSNNGDKIRYNNREFIAERPAIPLPGIISWLYQLAGSINESRTASIYIIDMFDTSASVIASLKTKGHTVICTISAGTRESWRPDASAFPASAVGRNSGNNEKWVDTRSSSIRNIMLSRLDLAKSKGCHGIDFDSVDAYANNSGFPLNLATQLEYNQYLAFAAHDRELILSLNNAPELAPQLSAIFDFAIAEQCFQYNECHKYNSFVLSGKPVLVAEYGNVSTQQCSQASEQMLSLSYLNESLDGSRYETCP